jgi:hypothetical protein
MIRGVKGMTGKTLLAGNRLEERAIVLGTLAALHGRSPVTNATESTRRR